MLPSAKTNTGHWWWKKLHKSSHILISFHEIRCILWCWSIALDHESSLLTTIISPLRRYWLLCLPFGLVRSQDIFCKWMYLVFKQCEGCISITNAINIYGCNKAEHDAKLWKLMGPTQNMGLFSASRKAHIKALLMPSSESSWVLPKNMG